MARRGKHVAANDFIRNLSNALKKSVIQYELITVLRCETSTAYNSASHGHGKIQKTPMAIVVSSHSFTVLRCRIKPTCSLKTRHLLTCCDMLKWSLAKSKNSSDCCNIFFFFLFFIPDLQLLSRCKLHNSRRQLRWVVFFSPRRLSLFRMNLQDGRHVCMQWRSGVSSLIDQKRHTGGVTGNPC